MTRKRSVSVAHTPFEEENLNKLRFPEFGVRGIVVKAAAAGAPKGKTHFPKGATDRSEGNDGTDDFHFAPEHETIAIVYDLHDPTGAVKKARLELFSRFDKKPLWTLDLAALGSDWLAHGLHTVKWDGRVIKQPAGEQKGTATADGFEHDLTALAVDDKIKALPDGYVTLEHTPYKLKLSIEGSEKSLMGDPANAWTYFHILIKKIELELGPEEAIPAKAVGDKRHIQDKGVRTKIDDDGGLPAKDAAAPLKVFLTSNVYRKTLPEMENDTFYTEYEKLWGDGPQIPILAKIRIADSSDNEVKIDETEKGAVALGRAKFLWDWEDPDEDTSAGDAKRQSFIGKAIDYYKEGTGDPKEKRDYPKGDDCHVDRGGKRGPKAKAVFPEHKGYDPKDTLDAGKFPFEVKSAKKRKWAAMSRGWRKGKLKGTTGALFQPSRMGGDDYVVSVYLAFDKQLDDKGKKTELVLDAVDEPLEAPEPIIAKTGKLQIWRKIYLSRYVAKDASLTFLPGNLAGFNPYFQEAFVEVEAEANFGADNNYKVSEHRVGGAAHDYNQKWQDIFDASGGWYWTASCAVVKDDDHASVDSMIKARPYADFVKRVHGYVHGRSDAETDQDFTDGGRSAATLGTTAAWVPPLSPPATPAVRLASQRLLATRNFLNNNGLENNAKYCKMLDDGLFGMSDKWLEEFKVVSGGKNGKAPDGIITVHFNFTNTQLRDLFAASGASFWYGKVADPSDADRTRSVIIFWVAQDDYFAHEAGHNLFLPHAKYPTASPPGGHQDHIHDDDDDGCLMSYSPARHGFCGLCQLRVRGWKGSVLDKDDTKNKKP